MVADRACRSFDTNVRRRYGQRSFKSLACHPGDDLQAERERSIRLMKFTMAATIALPLALFVYASWLSWRTTTLAADREILRTVAGAW